MQTKSSHDPVGRQVEALQRLWGSTAPNVAQRYLDDAKKIKKRDRIEFWEEVIRALSAVPGEADTVPLAV